MSTGNITYSLQKQPSKFFIKTCSTKITLISKVAFLIYIHHDNESTEHLHSSSYLGFSLRMIYNQLGLESTSIDN